MASSTTTTPAEMTSSLRPVANSMPRSVSFGATPSLERFPDSHTSSKKSSRTSLKASELHHKMKPISAQYKECEAKMAKLCKDESKKNIAGLMNWLQTKIKGGYVKKE